MSHNDDCKNPEFGEGGFGEDPFGGGVTFTGGGPIPSDVEFDIYCLSCASVPTILTYDEVTYDGQSGQFIQDLIEFDALFASGGAYPTDNLRVTIDVPVPEAFTWEFNVTFRALPENFNNIQDSHIYFGAFDAQGNSVGLFISEVGLLYTGSVHHSAGVIVLDSLVQALPNSDLLVEKDKLITVRIVTSYETGATYIYWTRHEDLDSIGHQLRYVLPAIKSASAIQVPADSTLISIKGTALDDSIIILDSMCLGTGLIIPNLLPRADAGLDQAVRTCSTVQLDASRSFDPEGSPLTYKWRLVDAPETSSFSFDSVDAITLPELTPTGFTSKIYSSDLADEHAEDPISSGDVIILRTETYEIDTLGIDGNGFYVDVGSSIIPDNVLNEPFKLLRQRGISGPTTIKPTFLPDKPGLYKFDLVVYDGGLYSEPAVVAVNVTESPIPRGLIPDMRFIWDYLGDFWKLVEDRERIEVFWSAFAQAASSELLSLWQVDYAKSLRDIQRTFQRRWLHYDLTLKEPSIYVEYSTVRAVYGGVRSNEIPVAGVAGVAGNHLDIFLPTDPNPLVIYFSGAGNLTPQQIVDRINAFTHAVSPELVARVTLSRDGLTARVRLNAPFSFSISGTSTVGIFGADTNGLPKGTAGVVTGSRSYRVERSLEGLDIVEGDYLVVGEGTYRIARVIDDATDDYFYQRLALLDDIDPNAGTEWLISGKTTSESIDFYDALVTAGDVVTMEIIDQETNVLSYVQVPATGVLEGLPNTLALDTTVLGHFLTDQYKVHFYSVTRRHYTPIDDLVADIPYLQEKVKNDDDTRVLRRNIDYFIDEFRGFKCLRFAVNNNVTYDIWEGLVPPDRMWAETTHLDNRPVIEQNFGIPAEFTLDDLSTLPENIDYLSAVRGLWYAYFSGPTLFNVRAGVQILLGMPFAEVESVIEEIRDDFSSAQGRLLLRDVANTEIVRSYTYPHGLELETNSKTGLPYAVGDTVTQFAPLVKGASVLDYVKDPTWFAGFVGQGRFSEVEKFHKFLVRVDSSAFTLSALLFVRSFVLRIKPNYTFPVFVVLEDLGETEVSVSDTVTAQGVLTIFDSPYTRATGEAQMFDQNRPAYGGMWSHFDQLDPNTPPTPYNDEATYWAFDQYDISPMPNQGITLKTTWAGGNPTADSLFYADMPVFTEAAESMRQGFILRVPATGIQIDVTKTSGMAGTINKVTVYARGTGNGATYNLDIQVNGVSQHIESLVIPASPEQAEWKFNIDVSIAVLLTDTLSIFITPPSDQEVLFHHFSVCLGGGADIFADTSLAAGFLQTGYLRPYDV